MSAALADAYRSSIHQPHPWFGWLLESIRTKTLGPELSVAEFLIDYSALEDLEKEGPVTKLAVRNILNENSKEPVDLTFLLQNKIVLLGDGTLGKARDNFVIPDRQDPAPGVYVHACATYSLVEAALYRWTPAGRFMIDLLLSLMVFGSVALISVSYERKTTQTVARQRLQLIFAMIIVLFVVLGGTTLVRITRLMWDDFILVSAALLLHPSVEKYGGRSLQWARDAFPAIWHRMAFQKEKKEKENHQ